MPFDRRAWTRNWMQRERARRRAVGVCGRCGFGLASKFLNCIECRRIEAKAALKRWRRLRQERAA